MNSTKVLTVTAATLLTIGLVLMSVDKGWIQFKTGDEPATALSAKDAAKFRQQCVRQDVIDLAEPSCLFKREADGRIFAIMLTPAGDNGVVTGMSSAGDEEVRVSFLTFITNPLGDIATEDDATWETYRLLYLAEGEVEHHVP